MSYWEVPLVEGTPEVSPQPGDLSAGQVETFEDTTPQLTTSAVSRFNLNSTHGTEHFIPLPEQ